MGSEMNENVVKKEALRLCRDFLGSPWTEISFSDFSLSIVSGGVSNALYCCSLPSNVVIQNPETPRRVLLRLYGPLQEEENKKVTETATFAILAEKGLGPKLYGVFQNGRIEEFIPSKHLPASDVRRLATSIARALAKVHALNLPLRKSPDTWLNHMTKWLEGIEAYRAREMNDSFQQKNMFINEIDFLRREVIKFDSPSVFCHNDLVQGNILLPDEFRQEKEPTLTIIDFEFGGYNCRSHDIANHLCEWAYDYDVSEPPYFTFYISRYPTEDEKINFIRAYLNQLVLEDVMKSSEVEIETKKILEELDFFNMSTQLYWAIWGEKNKYDPKIGIFHKKNSETRMESYWRFKENYLVLRRQL